MWREDTLLDAALASIGQHQPVYMLRQVAVADRRIDAVAVVPGGRVGIEAKTSLVDFHRETDAKREPTWRATHACVYLCPDGLIEQRDLPHGWGLWYATGPATVRVVRQPQWHQPEPGAVDRYASDLTERAAAVERRIRIAQQAEDPAAAQAAADREVQRLEGLLARQCEATERERARAQDAAEQVAALFGEQVCAACGEPITYRSTGAWKHRERAQERRCEDERAEVERLRREALTGARYGKVPAPRVIPAGLSIEH